MRESCLKCHFLAKTYRDRNGRVITYALDEDERNAAKRGEIEFIRKEYACSCFNGVWDEGVGIRKDNRLKEVLKNRKGSCFFYMYQPGMLFGAAQKIQKRNWDNSQLKQSNMYTRIGLWVASGALLIQSLVALVKGLNLM